MVDKYTVIAYIHAFGQLRESEGAMEQYIVLATARSHERRVVVLFLQGLGYRVLTVKTVEEALCTCSEANYPVAQVLYFRGETKEDDLVSLRASGIRLYGLNDTMSLVSWALSQKTRKHEGSAPGL